MKMYLIAAVFIALDFVTGLIKALAAHTFSSTKMREGLFHKAALAVVVVLGLLLDYAQAYLALGFTVPVAGAVCVYVVLMELASIVENLGQVNPQLVPSKLLALFGVTAAADVSAIPTTDAKSGEYDIISTTNEGIELEIEDESPTNETEEVSADE